MAKHVIVGCAGLPTGVGWPRYFQRLPYLELNALHIGPVRPAVVKRWRQSVSHDGAFGVVAPAIITHEPGPKGFGPKGWPVPAGRRAEIGRFRPNDMRDHGVNMLRDGVAALRASVAVFRTGPEFSPSAANRDLMRQFFAEVVPADSLSGALRVWQPSGLWDPPMAHAFAAELGIVCAHDPLTSDPTGEFAPFYAALEGEDAYLIISGLGRARRHLSGEQLEEIAMVAQRHQRAWVVMATNQPFPDAIRFGRTVAALEHGDDPDDADSDVELSEPSDDPDDEEGDA